MSYLLAGNDDQYEQLSEHEPIGLVEASGKSVLPNCIHHNCSTLSYLGKSDYCLGVGPGENGNLRMDVHQRHLFRIVYRQ